MNKQNVNDLLKISAAICLLMIGFAFFYRHVIYLPQQESLKQFVANKAELEEMRSAARSLLLEFFSLADTAMSYGFGPMTHGESVEKFQLIASKAENLKSSALAFKTAESDERSYQTELINQIDALIDYCKLEVKGSEYYMQGVDLEQKISVLRNNARIYRSGYYPDHEQANLLDSRANEMAQMKSEKNSMIANVDKEIEGRSTALVKGTWQLYNNYGSMFDVGSDAVFALSQKLVANQKNESSKTK